MSFLHSRCPQVPSKLNPSKVRHGSAYASATTLDGRQTCTGARTAGTPAAPAESEAPTGIDRVTASLEVLLCSGFPTQLALGASLATMACADDGFGQLLLTCVVLRLAAGYGAPRRAHPGVPVASRRAPAGRFLRHPTLAPRGAGRNPLTFVALGLALGGADGHPAVGALASQRVEHPLQELIRTPGDVALFAIVVVVAGGVREELQRAFLLHWFERSLGGGGFGVVVTSPSFGAGHLLQGSDAVSRPDSSARSGSMIYLRPTLARPAPMVSPLGLQPAAARSVRACNRPDSSQRAKSPLDEIYGLTLGKARRTRFPPKILILSAFDIRHF